MQIWLRCDERKLPGAHCAGSGAEELEAFSQYLQASRCLAAAMRQVGKAMTVADVARRVRLD